jgi:hypothetical protein
MKYLSSRDNYLKNLNERRNSEKINQINQIKPVLENYASSGPFTNELRWGDSLLGRLIHHITRKAIIGTKMVRIKGVVERLYQAMDDLLVTSTISTLDDEDKKLWSRAIIAEYLIAIQESVDDYAEGKNGVKLIDIKNYVNTAIEKVEQEESLEKKNELLRRLNDFKKFLEPLKEENTDNSENTEEVDDRIKEIEDKLKDEDLSDEKRKELEEELARLKEVKGDLVEQEEKSVDKEDVSDESPSGMYPTMIKALKSLSLILVNYKKFTPNAIKSAPEDNFYLTKAGDTVDKIQKDVNINKKKLSLVDIRSKNKAVLNEYPKDNQTLKPGLKLVLESNYLFEAGPIAGSNKVGSTTPIGSGSGDQRNKGSEQETHATQAYMKLKSACQQLEDVKNKGVGVTVDFINQITSKSNDENTKKAIKSLFIEINRYLVGDKKGTLNVGGDPLFKESLEVISDKNKKVIVAEKIARFTVRALQFDGQNLYGELGDVGNPLKDYVECLKFLKTMTSESPKKEEKSEEVQKEKLIFKYNKFISFIKEADEEVKDVNKQSVPGKIQDYLTQKIDFKEWILDKTEVQKIKTTMEKKMAENKDSVTINGIDPVMDIVRCFNRAYKLHTVSVIPSNRQGGAVSNAIFSEYEAFGNGTPENAGESGGPYRNKAIFNIWEDEVLKLMRDKSYQKIFNVGTRLKNGNDYIEKAGMNLRKFMTDMLDGDELYKSGESGNPGGAQAKFLDKYFGYKDGDKDGGKDLSVGGSEEMKEITNNADSIKPIKLMPVKDGIKFDKPSDLSNTFFVIQGNKSGDPTTLFCYIHDVRGDVAYVSFCQSSYHILKYISKSKLSQGVSPQGLLNNNKSIDDKNGNLWPIKATRIDVSKFWDKSGKFTSGGTIDISSMEKEPKEDGDKKKTTNVYDANCQLDESFRMQSVVFFNLVDLEKGSNADSYQRIKAEGDIVDSFVKQPSEGGFTTERVIKETEATKVRIKNA